MTSTALLAVRMASESGFQVSINSPAARSTRSCNGDESWCAAGAVGLDVVRRKPGYTNRATKRAMLAAAATMSFIPLPPRAGLSISCTPKVGAVSTFSAFVGGADTLDAGGSILAGLSTLTAFSFFSFLSFFSILSFLPGLSAFALSGTIAGFSSTAGAGGATIAAGAGVAAGAAATGAAGAVGSGTGALGSEISRREAIGTICARAGAFVVCAAVEDAA